MAVPTYTTLDPKRPLLWIGKRRLAVHYYENQDSAALEKEPLHP